MGRVEHPSIATRPPDSGSIAAPAFKEPSMPVPNPTRRTGPRRSALLVAGLAAALTVGAASVLTAPAAPPAAAVVVLPADPTPPAQTVVTTVYQVTPTPAPAQVVVVHRVVAGGENENEGND
jgi:hypothetical protein